MTLFLDFRYQGVGGATRKEPVFLESDPSIGLRWLQESAFVQRIDNRHLLIATHGYNNDRLSGACALTRFEERLGLPPESCVIGVLWPGDSSLGGISYPVEKRTAEDTGRYLATYLRSKLAGSASVSFVSHSLGARVVLEATRNLGRAVRSATLMAGAIERNCLTQEYADAFAKIGVVRVIASRNDTVLRNLFPLGNLIANILDPTANPLSKALGFDGPERPVGRTVPPWQIDTVQVYRHGNYLPPGDPAQPMPSIGAGALFDKPIALARQTFLAEL